MGHDEDHDERAESLEVLVRCSNDPDLVIRLSNRQAIDGDETVFSIEAKGDGLRATIRDVTIAIWDGAGDPSGFLQQLADDFRGWPGTRTWHNNQLTIEATFHSGGHVELTWKLRPWTSGQTAWEASITTWIEPASRWPPWPQMFVPFSPGLGTRPVPKPANARSQEHAGFAERLAANDDEAGSFATTGDKLEQSTG